MSQTVERRYVGVRDAETYSGLSHDTLERLIREGRLSSFRPRGKRLIDLHELDRVIRESGRAAASG